MSAIDSTADERDLIHRAGVYIAALALLGIGLHLGALALPAWEPWANWPLYVALALGGTPLVIDLGYRLLQRQFGSDLLAGISIITAVLLGEYLAGVLVVLMLSGGEALEGYAVRRASSVLEALARRMPSVAHRQTNGTTVDIAIDEIRPGDTLVVYPHEICPADGEVLAGQGSMDESYLTGEPYEISKTPGSSVISGAINGPALLTIRSTASAKDSRYARIMQVMDRTRQQRPRLRRLGDALGALYTPIAVVIALGAWLATGDPIRFLAVLVVATPCPLLIAIPVAIIGAISLSAKRGIIIKDPAVLERTSGCQTIIFDKTGTLTYGVPRLVEVVTVPPFTESEVLKLAASVEAYSKHPLAGAVLRAADAAGIKRLEVREVHEPPGQGLVAVVNGSRVELTGRKRVPAEFQAALPPVAPGLECIILVDGRYAATLRFRDEPREESRSFVGHLLPHHAINRVMIVSGDRASEVHHLAERVGITEVHAGAAPEEKVEIVRRETAAAGTIYLGDGINDAPALLAATVGIGFGSTNEITSEAAGAVILEPSLRKVDEFLHISHRMRRIALESAVGGMALSVVGMGFAASGHLSPVNGALLQEAIDLFAVLNALRAASGSFRISDI